MIPNLDCHMQPQAVWGLNKLEYILWKEKNMPFSILSSKGNCVWRICALNPMRVALLFVSQYPSMQRLCNTSRSGIVAAAKQQAFFPPVLSKTSLPRKNKNESPCWHRELLKWAMTEAFSQKKFYGTILPCRESWEQNCIKAKIVIIRHF